MAVVLLSGSVLVRYSGPGSLDFGAWALNAYAIDYDFTLYSDFTYFLDDAVDLLSGVEDVHFHPLEPRTIRASVILHWD